MKSFIKHKLHEQLLESRVTYDYKHVRYVLGINIPLNENLISEELKREILYEQMLYEDFLGSIKNFVGDKWEKGVTTITDAKEAAVFLGKILSNPQLLSNFTGNYWKRIKRTQLQGLYGILEKIKLDKLVIMIKDFVNKITSLDGWKKFLLATAVGSLITYITTKLSAIGTIVAGSVELSGITDKLSSFISEYISDNALGVIISKLTDVKSYLGWLAPIIGGIQTLYISLKPTIDKFNNILI